MGHGSETKSQDAGDICDFDTCSWLFSPEF